MSKKIAGLVKIRKQGTRFIVEIPNRIIEASDLSEQCFGIIAVDHKGAITIRRSYTSTERVHKKEYASAVVAEIVN